jgi:hypothetical protein
VPCDRLAAVNAVPEDRGRREFVTESYLVVAHPRKISAVMLGIGNLGVHLLRRAEQRDLQLPRLGRGEYAVVLHLGDNRNGVCAGTPFSELGSAPDS